MSIPFIGIDIHILHAHREDDQRGRASDAGLALAHPLFDLRRLDIVRGQVPPPLFSHPSAERCDTCRAGYDAKAPRLTIMSGWRPDGRFQQAFDQRTWDGAGLITADRSPPTDQCPKDFVISDVSDGWFSR